MSNISVKYICQMSNINCQTTVKCHKCQTMSKMSNVKTVKNARVVTCPMSNIKNVKCEMSIV